MRINVTTLKEIVNANRQTVQQQAQKCQSQIETLNRISTDSGICDSKAYRSMFDYLRRVKVPALMQQVVFLEAYVTDMQTDLDRLSELETDGSGILDTDELTHQLNNLRLINDDIARWIERNREQNPTACFHVTQVMQGNQDFMAHLQQQIDLALTYGSDSSIYASCRHVYSRCAETGCERVIRRSHENRYYDADGRKRRMLCLRRRPGQPCHRQLHLSL